MDHLDFIAARMEEVRFERGIPVAELARRIGVDRKRLWRVLNGERAMRADEFVRLCAELGVGLAFFAPEALRAVPSGKEVLSTDLLSIWGSPRRGAGGKPPAAGAGARSPRGRDTPASGAPR